MRTKEAIKREMFFYHQAQLPPEAVKAWYESLAPQEQALVQEIFEAARAEIETFFVALGPAMTELGQAIGVGLASGIQPGMTVQEAVAKLEENA